MCRTYFTVDFKLGKVVVLTGPGEKICAVRFDLEGRFKRRPSGLPAAAMIEEYFLGRDTLHGLKVEFPGDSPFQRMVYMRVREIQYGETLTYGEVAAQVGCPGGARAVGRAMAGNRFPLIVPCHRVVSGSKGAGGFSSGPELKKFLLRLEGAGF